MTQSGHARPEINCTVGELRHSRRAGAVLNIGHGIQGVKVPMSVTHPDSVTFEKSFAALPLATYEAGETVKRTRGLLCQRRPAMKEIFLSYSRPDSSTVQALAAALEEKGVSV